MLNFIIFFDGFWSGLGTLLGPLLGAKMAQNRSKIGPEGSRNAILLKKTIFTEYYVFQYFFHVFDPKMELKKAQDRTKRATRGSRQGSLIALIFDFDF